ncbi:MAG: copper resistance protein NlpE N-terminal domain-containing protein [Methylococcales bacterium]|nr:copper resistance protein NlpE N-terminal domain-containing protein [Methylococcales bacterium]
MKRHLIASTKILTVLLVSLSSLAFNPASAKSDMEIMGDVQRAREKLRAKKGHEKHEMKPIEESQKYRGVFYGYLPCDDCAGVKMTLSLKNKQNYLLVTQYARASNKEYYNKGKYEWNKKTRMVTLTARKGGEIQKYRIKNDGKLILLTPEGLPLKGNQNKYTLLRTDKNKARSVHIH